jgi:hypothetical protein
MSGAGLHFRLRHLHLRRAAVVGLAFVVELSASCWLPMVRADDRAADPQATAELAVRKRILANWQARQDRIKSFYVAWKPGPNDGTIKWRSGGFVGMHRLWVVSDGRFRQESSAFAFGQHPILRDHVEVFDGKFLRTLLTPRKVGNPDRTLRSLPAGRYPIGNIRTLKDLSERRRFGLGGAKMLAFRPLQSPWADWTLENSRVTSQNAVVGRGHFVEIQKTDPKSGITEACWVDPQRSDLVIHFQTEFASGTEDWTSLEYKQDPRGGWVLAGWQGESRDINDLGTRRGKRSPMAKAVVTECKINDEFPSGTFQLKFPAGTIVHDHDSKCDYFVRRDGSQRRIDFSKLGNSIKYEQLVNEDTTRPAKPERSSLQPR